MIGRKYLIEIYNLFALYQFVIQQHTLIKRNHLILISMNNHGWRNLFFFRNIIQRISWFRYFRMICHSSTE